ncbi:zinc metalloprotease HtpX [Natronogracilivirgula saccharolytica]|uniref:Protease HtpX homolog n=1 Tax=Natronogracilivirga saccharolytica TaxID=2812953 RepID=A0A8J7RJW6_9BACT|nr:zinc metalloprotease HtpX [Natronogracilivirga saccharolytica]MBP3193090.1 zinc metalloprotease HtpX [Natronogracilivirga saccharolytica]
MIKNSMRTVFLMALVGALFLLVGNVLGGQGGMVIAFIFAMLMNFFSYWYSDKMVLKMYRAKEVTRENAPQFYGMVEDLARRADLPMPKVYIIPQQQPNAFATGRNPQNAAVAATQGILQSLNERELRGVMAHELAHIKNRDILTQTIVTAFVSAITMISQFAIFLPIGRGGGDGPNPIVLLLTLILAPLAAGMLQAAISRTREFEADRVGAEICGSAESLANALKKIQASVQQMPMQASETAQRSTAHMFPVNPFSARGMSKLFSTHPDTGLRIRKLMNMEKTGVYS